MNAPTPPTDIAAFPPAPPASTAPVPHVRIRPSRGWQAIPFRELWRYRELLFQLAWRDIRIRYKQTLLGAGWAILQPLFTMVVFTIFFGRLAGLEDRIQGGIPYPVYTFCALLPWQLFSTAISQSGASVVNNRGLITKVYFPRLIVPMVPLLSGLVDFAVALGMLGILMVIYGVVPTAAVLTLPLFLLLALATALAAGLWLSALNALYRDVQYTLGFLTQFWMFATPIAYPSSLVPPEWRPLYGLNPMVGVIDGFRWALLGAELPSPLSLTVSVTCVLLALVGGLFFFRRMESVIADVV